MDLKEQVNDRVALVAVDLDDISFLHLFDDLMVGVQDSVCLIKAFIESPEKILEVEELTISVESDFNFASHELSPDCNGLALLIDCKLTFETFQ